VLAKLVFCSVEKDVPGDVDASSAMIFALSASSHAGGILIFAINDLSPEVDFAISGGRGDSSFGFVDDDLGVDLVLDLGVDFGPDLGFALDLGRALVGVFFAFLVGGGGISLADASTLCLRLRLRS
jgi:hypothetical protein